MVCGVLRPARSALEQVPEAVTLLDAADANFSLARIKAN